jgi:hypothetical protein
MASQWVSVDLQAGYPAPGNVDDSALVPIGTIAQFRDVGTTYLGVGEFVYLRGIGSTVLGSVVYWKGSTGAATSGLTTLATTAIANSGFSLAFATAAIVADKYGWYQISGAAIAATTGTVADADDLFLGAAVLTATPAAGLQVLSCHASSANGVPASNQAIITINRPFCQGQDAAP